MGLCNPEEIYFVQVLCIYQVVLLRHETQKRVLAGNRNQKKDVLGGKKKNTKDLGIVGPELLLAAKELLKKY